MRGLVPAAVAALALVLGSAPVAGASEEVGNPCLGDATEPGATMIAFSNQGSEPFMYAQVPPESRFVITRWRVRVAPGLGPLQQQLVASHHVAEEESVVDGESAVETLVDGSNEFATRIPVPEGANLGLRGPEQTLVCHQALNSAGRVKGEWAVGERRHFEVLVNVGVPVIVEVERDRDGDGYGDETQDGCPGDGAFHDECRYLSLRARSNVRRRAVLVHVTPSNDTSVQVYGQVVWRVRKQGGTKRLVAGLSAGAPRVVTERTIGTFRLPLPPAVQRRLARLFPVQSLRAVVTVAGTDVFGQSVERQLPMKLYGQRRHTPRKVR